MAHPGATYGSGAGRWTWSRHSQAATPAGLGRPGGAVEPGHRPYWPMRCRVRASSGASVFGSYGRSTTTTHGRPDAVSNTTTAPTLDRDGAGAWAGPG